MLTLKRSQAQHPFIENPSPGKRLTFYVGETRNTIRPAIWRAHLAPIVWRWLIEKMPSREIVALSKISGFPTKKSATADARSWWSNTLYFSPFSGVHPYLPLYPPLAFQAMITNHLRVLLWTEEIPLPAHPMPHLYNRQSTTHVWRYIYDHAPTKDPIHIPNLAFHSQGEAATHAQDYWLHTGHTALTDHDIP